MDHPLAPPFGAPALTPLHFLERSAVVHATRTAVVDGDRRFTYAELAARAACLAGGLRGLGVTPGEPVSVLVPNTSAALEAHFGVPWSGALLNMLNVRLNSAELTVIVGHAGSRVLLVDHELAAVGTRVADATGARLVIVGGPDDAYEALLARAEPLRTTVVDEWSPLALNYTSGTTGAPKGATYAHRGAYLQSLAMALHSGLDAGARFLWTLPMFHCNGWCFPWALTAVGATHVMLRHVDPESIWLAIRDEHGVTHLNAAPTVLTALAYGPWADVGPAPRRLHVGTGGSPPSPTLLARLAELNIAVSHLYGLTETYGPAVLCDWHPEWDALPADERARLLARQGVPNVIGEELRVVDPAGLDVAADGASIGEVLVRGNNVMIGYYRDDAATERASHDGWFRTGDLAVRHPDGYVELRDRAKDVIISGGENIPSIEVEQALYSHPAVLECAVVAAPDDHWGEVPVAYVVLQDAASATEAELIEHVRTRIARFKAPKRIHFEALPKTATGKIQKFVLRERLWESRPTRIG